MTCKKLCQEYKARRITTKFGTLYTDNFRCKTCNCYISPLGTIKQNGIRCTCCKQKVKSKSPRKMKITVR